MPPNDPVAELTSPQTGTEPLKRRTLPETPGLVTKVVVLLEDW